MLRRLRTTSVNAGGLAPCSKRDCLSGRPVCRDANGGWRRRGGKPAGRDQSGSFRPVRLTDRVVDKARRQVPTCAMGIAISPRGDMPKHRVQLSFSEDASCRQSTPSPPTSLPASSARPDCPVLIDVQTDEDFAADPRLIPGAVRRPFRTVSEWAPEFAGRSAVVICQKGLKLSQGVAAWLRHAGVPADVARRRRAGLGGGRPADGARGRSCRRATRRAAPSG